MNNEYSKAVYFGLGYSALASLAFLCLRFGLSLDIITYPYQKPIMLVIAAIALIACIILLVYDIRRKCECGIGIRVIIAVGVIVLTFDSFMSIWCVLMLYIGGA